jgi:hypothetical protein
MLSAGEKLKNQSTVNEKSSKFQQETARASLNGFYRQKLNSETE